MFLSSGGKIKNQCQTYGKGLRSMAGAGWETLRTI